MINRLAKYLQEKHYPEMEIGEVQSLLTKPEKLKEALKSIHEDEYSDVPFSQYMKKVEASPVEIDPDPKFKPYDFEASNPEFSNKIKYMRDVLNQPREELPHPPMDPAKAKALVLFAKYAGANTNGPGTDVFELEAKRALPLLKKKYGKDVAVEEVPYGDHKHLKELLEKYKNADVFPFDHSGDKIMGIPVSQYGMDTEEPSIEDAKYSLNAEDFERYISMKQQDEKSRLDPNNHPTNQAQDFIHYLNEKSYEDTGKPLLTRKDTWSTAFPKDNKGKVCWGACHFNEEAQKFTNESKIPSVSTNTKSWNGVAGMHGEVKSEPDFLKYMYHNSDYIEHLPE